MLVLACLRCLPKDEQVYEDINKLLSTMVYLTAAVLAKERRTSVEVAKQHLLQAETVGKLCRDETVAGLSFYPNKFLTPPR